MNLFYKIGAVIFVGALFILSVAGVLTFYLTKSALQQSVSINQAEIARQTLDKIDRLLYERYLDFETIADERDLEEFLAVGGGSTANIKRHINELTFLTGPWDELFLIDTKGHILLSSSVDDSGVLSNEERAAYDAALVGQVYYSDYLLYKGHPTMFFAAAIADKSNPNHPV